MRLVKTIVIQINNKCNQQCLHNIQWNCYYIEFMQVCNHEYITVVQYDTFHWADLEPLKSIKKYRLKNGNHLVLIPTW